MISLTSIITAIKGAGIATKIGLSVGAVAVVVGGGFSTAIIVNNTNKTPQTQQIASEVQNDDNSPSEQNGTQNEDTGEPEDDNSKGEQAADDKKPTTNNSQTTTQKPNSNTSNQSTSNNSPASKPSNPTPAQPSQPSQPAQPTKKPDYNLNDKYVAGYDTYNFYIFDKSKPELQQCVEVERKAFLGVAKFTGSGADLINVTASKAWEYAKSKGYNTTECWGGMGTAPMTWQDAINMGIALDEAKCAQYGLSCGRW